MSELNPYATPSVDVDDEPAPRQSPKGIWRDGNAVVVPRRAQGSVALPDRCVCCNAPAHGFKLERKVYWHRRALLLWCLINPVIYVFVALAVRKSVKLAIGLCERHNGQRRLGLFVLVATVASTALLGVFHRELGGVFAVFAITVAPLGIVLGLALWRVIFAQRMDDNHAWLRVGAPFLDSIGRRGRRKAKST